MRASRLFSCLASAALGAGEALPPALSLHRGERREGMPPLMLAEVYRPGMSLHDYWVSEKYDGVRGYWDGKQLWRRGGERDRGAHMVHCRRCRPTPIDGELWVGRGRFANAVSTVRSQTPIDITWRELHWHDVRPARPGVATSPARLAVLRKLLPITDRHLGGRGSPRSAQPRTRTCRLCSTRR